MIGMGGGNENERGGANKSKAKGFHKRKNQGREGEEKPKKFR